MITTDQLLALIVGGVIGYAIRGLLIKHKIKKIKEERDISIIDLGISKRKWNKRRMINGDKL